VRTGVAVAAWVAGLCLTGAAFAGKLNQTSEAEIEKMLGIVAPSGERMGAIRYGELPAGGVFSFTFEGNRTLEYYVNAICDDDCTDLNLAVLDSAGVEIDVDNADDAAPSLNVQADLNRSPVDAPIPAPRLMTIEVRMLACQAASCAYGISITAMD
jgi:hypothetical protein